MNTAVIPTCIKGTKTGLAKIINTYNKIEQAFVIGNKHLMATPGEFGIIMGITSGNKVIDMKDCQVGPTSLLKRKFDGMNLVKPQHLKAQLLKSILGAELVDIHDTVKIFILHVLACILFLASNEVARIWIFRICDNINNLATTTWARLFSVT